MRLAARLERVEQVQAQQQTQRTQEAVQAWFAFLTDEEKIARLREDYQSDARFVDAPEELDRLFQRENRGELMRRLHDDLYPEGKLQ